MIELSASHSEQEDAEGVSVGPLDISGMPDIADRLSQGSSKGFRVCVCVCLALSQRMHSVYTQIGLANNFARSCAALTF